MASARASYMDELSGFPDEASTGAAAGITGEGIAVAGFTVKGIAVAGFTVKGIALAGFTGAGIAVAGIADGATRDAGVGLCIVGNVLDGGADC